MASHLSLGEMLDNRSLPIISYFGPHVLFADGCIVAHGAVRVQCGYNSTQRFHEFGPWIYVRIFRNNVEMASAF